MRLGSSPDRPHRRLCRRLITVVTSPLRVLLPLLLARTLCRSVSLSLLPRILLLLLSLTLLLEPGSVERLRLLPGPPLPLLPPPVRVRLRRIRIRREVQPVVIIAAAKIPRAGGAIRQALVDPLRHAVTLAAVAQASESLPHNSSATVRRLATTPRLHAVGSCHSCHMDVGAPDRVAVGALG